MSPTQFVNENVCFNEPVNNQIFNDSTFARIIYSNNVITTNGVYLKLDIKGATVDKRFNKTTLQFNIYNNGDLIAHIQTIEHLLLSTIKNRTPIYNIYNELVSGRIFVHNHKDVVVLKISGIWETELNCGITYKFVCV
jgi:hypothetical protein